MSPRALAVDPELLARIRPMETRDLADVARLHGAMGTSLWASLGDRFVRQVYRALLAHPDFLAFVYQEQGRVSGFIAGTSHGPRLFRQTALRHGPALAAATLSALLQRPAALLPLLETALYFQRSAGPPGAGDAVPAESMFCSFDRNLRGRGAPGLINKVLFDALAARGHQHVKITTEAANLLAARQLVSWGFVVRGRFQFYGKSMILWRLDLLHSPRVTNPPK